MALCSLREKTGGRNHLDHDLWFSSIDSSMILWLFNMRQIGVLYFLVIPFLLPFQSRHSQTSQ